MDVFTFLLLISLSAVLPVSLLLRARYSNAGETDGAGIPSKAETTEGEASARLVGALVAVAAFAVRCFWTAVVLSIIVALVRAVWASGLG